MDATTPALRFGSPLPQARLVLVMLHGRGSEPEDMAGLAQALPQDGVHFIAPAAVGNAWYPNRFFVPTIQNEPHLSNALRVVDQLIHDVRQAGLNSDRIGLVGFSQGACLALEFAARHPDRYALVGALSGGLIGPLDAPRAKFDLGRTPVLIGCADHDPHIPLDFVEHSAAVFAASGAEVTKQIFPGPAHTVFPSEIRWLSERIRNRN